MNFDPQKFFIGLMDFFSILLPGALLTWLLADHVGPAVLGDRYANLDGAQAWAAFLFANYLFGQLVFLFGSWLDEIYDGTLPSMMCEDRGMASVARRRRRWSFERGESFRVPVRMRLHMLDNNAARHSSILKIP